MRLAQTGRRLDVGPHADAGLDGAGVCDGGRDGAGVCLLLLLVVDTISGRAAALAAEPLH